MAFLMMSFFCDRNFPNLIFLFNFDKFVLICILNKMVFKCYVSCTFLDSVG